MRTFDLSLLGREHFEASKWRRRATTVVGAGMAGLVSVVLGFLVLAVLLDPFLGRTRQLFAIALAAILGYVVVGLSFKLKEYVGGNMVRECLVTTAGEVTFLFSNGARTTTLLSDPFLMLRVGDYRTTLTGTFDSAPCIVSPGGEDIPCTGAVCDAIIETARALGAKVTVRSEPTASMSGRSLGPATYWDIRGAKGTILHGWSWR